MEDDPKLVEVPPAQTPPALPRDLPWMGAALVFYGAMAAIGLVWIALDGGRELLAARALGARPLVGLGLGVGAGIAMALAGVLLGRLVPAWRRLESAFTRLLGPISPATVVVLALVSGIAEELLFRGALQPAIGLVPAALLFAAVHFPFERSLLLWPLFALVAGLALGVLFQVTGAVLAPAAAHAVVNAIGLERAAAVARRSR